MTKWNYYSIGCGFFGLCLFMYGFFLTGYFSKNHTFFTSGRNDSRNDINVPKNEIFNKPYVEKVVLMVIDSLRYDFVAGKHLSRDMPYLSSLIQNGQTCVYPCKVQMPTVTMPRIKTLCVGAVSDFVDVVLNFGSNRVYKDNILAQAVKANKKIVFYGDDTWIKLFPNTFSRHEETVSFFVTDFVEVDANVTRNVLKEIKNDDWDIMILHYLGLDHIGHIEGPASPKISWKLKEMDDVIRKINRQLVRWKKKKNSDYLMVVCGDHGMKDSGGHGGSTTGETVVGFVSIGIPCSPEKQIYQVDIAVTLSILLGLPIPRENMGKVIPGLIKNLSPQKQLDAYLKNSKQLIENYENIIGPLNLNLRKNVSLHAAQKLQNDEKYDDALKAYQSLLSHLSSKLIESLTEFDILCLIFGVLMIFQASYIPCITVAKDTYVIRNVVFVGILSTGILYLICYLYSFNSLLCDLSTAVLALHTFIFFILSLNSVLLFKSLKFSRLRRLKNVYRFLKRDPVLLFILLCNLIYVISTHSTSFIEEEHMMWYFYWTSFLVVLITDSTKKTDIALIFSLLVLHRILRKLNQTGIQWDGLPDIGDWLSLVHNKPYLSIYTVLGLMWAYISLHHRKTKEKKKQTHRKGCIYLNILNNVCNVLCLVTVYVFRAAVNDVSFISLVKSLLSAKGVSEFRFFISLFIITIVVKFARVFFHRYCKPSAKFYLLEIITSVLDLWTILSCLLLRVHNIMLPGTLRFVSSSISKVLNNQSNKVIKLVIIHHWLARVYFFYQGNSNSLASIDVATGYIGQTEYNSVKVGTLLICATYAMPILAYLLSIRHFIKFLVKHYTKSLWKSDWSASRSSAQLSIDSLLILENLHVFVYVVVIIIHRHHLFIWSVFSPKLIYVSFYLLFLYPFLIFLQFIINSFPRNCV